MSKTSFIIVKRKSINLVYSPNYQIKVKTHNQIEFYYLHVPMCHILPCSEMVFNINIKQ